MDNSQPSFPVAYLHFIQHGLTDLEPWSLMDSAATVQEVPDLDRDRVLAEVGREETGLDAELYLFARRYDQDDYAFFVVRNGRLEDKVVARHLAFSKRREAPEPLRYEEITLTFLEWMQGTVLSDIAFELGVTVPPDPS